VEKAFWCLVAVVNRNRNYYSHQQEDIEIDGVAFGWMLEGLDTSLAKRIFVRLPLCPSCPSVSSASMILNAVLLFVLSCCREIARSIPRQSSLNGSSRCSFVYSPGLPFSRSGISLSQRVRLVLLYFFSSFLYPLFLPFRLTHKRLSLSSIGPFYLIRLSLTLLLLSRSRLLALPLPTVTPYTYINPTAASPAHAPRSHLPLTPSQLLPPIELLSTPSKLLASIESSTGGLKEDAWNELRGKARVFVAERRQQQHAALAVDGRAESSSSRGGLGGSVSSRFVAGRR
jgi:hypothetical protein